MNVSIQGLGPRFRLLLNLSNEGQDLATDLQVSSSKGLHWIGCTAKGIAG
jgi:hypothetical protein